jgi:hypothetical protein
VSVQDLDALDARGNKGSLTPPVSLPARSFAGSREGSEDPTTHRLTRGVPTQLSSGRPPANGTVVYRRQGPQGRGRLTIENGRKTDAVVSLLEGSDPRRQYAAIYVQAGQRATLAGIAEGTYVIQFRLGQEWDRKVFRIDAGSFEYEKRFEFAETITETETQRRHYYDTATITLHPVPDGTVKFRPIPTRPIDLEGQEPYRSRSQP